jgi:hypothetical protein
MGQQGAPEVALAAQFRQPVWALRASCFNPCRGPCCLENATSKRAASMLKQQVGPPWASPFFSTYRLFVKVLLRGPLTNIQHIYVRRIKNGVVPFTRLSPFIPAS